MIRSVEKTMIMNDRLSIDSSLIHIIGMLCFFVAIIFLIISESTLYEALITSQSREVCFSRPSGFYRDSFNLKLCSNSGTIYYTTDGSAPDQNARIYREPIELQEGDVTVSAVFANLRACSDQEIS